MIRLKFKYMPILAALLLSVGVVSCGVKPKTLSPPEGKEDSTFPRTYPDIKHDPKAE